MSVRATSNVKDEVNSKASSNLTASNSTGKSSSGDTKSDKENATDVRAQFADAPERSNKIKPQASPLLSSTPPTVAKALVRSYPYLLIMNKVLSIITWTNDDYWINVVIVSLYALIILYFEKIITWFGHLIIVGLVTSYSILNTKIIEETNLHPTLDDVVQALTVTCNKADLLLNPITSLALNAYDIKRLLFTTLFLTPVYLLVTFFVVTPRLILLTSGVYILTYHSTFSCATRKMLWKIKIVRLLCYYLTGLDFLRAKNHSLFAAAFVKVQKNSGLLNSGTDPKNRNVRFTYVIYENQRRWLGIGWTSNLLSYERAPWTDEFLNESSSVETFRLPSSEDSDYSFGNYSYLANSGAKWRWVDKTWRLDLTNDGAITLPSNKRYKTTADPGLDEGYIYYDNMWKKPSTEDSYSKYTRRRRWIRTAELVFDDGYSKIGTTLAEPSKAHATGNSISTLESVSAGKKSLRFAESTPENDNTEKLRKASESNEREPPADPVSIMLPETTKSSPQVVETVPNISSSVESPKYDKKRD